MNIGALSALIFVLAIIISVVVLSIRRLKMRRGRRAWASLSGHSPQTALSISRFDEMDRFVRQTRCPCGGLLKVVSEGSREVAGHKLRVSRCECNRCESELDFFFDMTEVKSHVGPTLH